MADKKVTDTTIRNAKPADKSYRLGIGENIYCEVMPTGKKVWRMRFLTPDTKKPAIYTFGNYDDSERRDTNPSHISLALVRRLADDAKHLIKSGIHPLRERERAKLAMIGEEQKTFEAVARKWWEVKREEWEPKNALKILRGLEIDVFPVIGHLQIDNIDAPELLRMLRKIEKRGAYDYTNRTKQRCSRIFSFAIGEGLSSRNPVPDIKSNLKKYQRKNYKYLTADQLPAFMNDLDRWSNPVVRLAIYLVIHTYLRTDEIRGARWDEVDYEARIWYVPAHRMKMKKEHRIPLPDQAITLLKELETYRKGEYLFCIRSKQEPMSDATMINCLYDLGYKGRATIHGFRSTFRTTAADAGWNREYSEAALAHKIIGVEGSYNHSTYFEQRRELMQWYSNLVDSLRTGADVVAIKRNQA